MQHGRLQIISFYVLKCEPNNYCFLPSFAQLFFLITLDKFLESELARIFITVYQKNVLHHFLLNQDKNFESRQKSF